MAKRNEIVEFLATELDLAGFKDYCPNGLQIEGAAEVSTLAVAVDAAQSTVNQALTLGAQMLLVHHGLFWREAAPLTGALGKIVKSCFDGNLSLYAVHLPLDAHPVHGNAAIICNMLELGQRNGFAEHMGRPVGICGRNQAQLSCAEIRRRLETLPAAKEAWKSFEFGPEVPRRIGVVTGAGADAIFAMQSAGLDTLITGEPKQMVHHFAKDRALNVLCAGHYASETVGVRALATLLEQRFALQTHFIDHPVGV